MLLCFALVLRADESTKKLVTRLGDEAAAFKMIAPQLLARETLHQRALAPPRFKMRVGDAAKQPQAADWKEHEIVSEYAFALLGRQIHELRQVISVDGKRVAGETEAQDALDNNRCCLLTDGVDPSEGAAHKETRAARGVR